MTLLPVSEGDPHVPAHNAERDAINALQEGLTTKISLPPGAATGDLLRWDGTQWLTTETRFFEGNGSPVGVVAAPIGSRYIDKAGTDGVVEWVKTSGAESNAGWQPVGYSDTGWTTVSSLGAGWSNQNPAGYTSLAYRKLNGIVYLRGLITTAGSRNTLIFTLPAGFRPTKNHHIPAIVSGAVNPQDSGINVHPTGDVYGRGPQSGWLSLDGISFIPD